jgi:hypothetical protein
VSSPISYGGFLVEIVSLIVGIVTGLIFERRATVTARRQNRELQRQVSVLKTSIFSMGAHEDGDESEPPPQDLAGLVTARAIATQDPAGRVNRRALFAHFVERGHRAGDIEAAVSSLCETGTAVEEGSWLQMA